MFKYILVSIASSKTVLCAAVLSLVCTLPLFSQHAGYKKVLDVAAFKQKFTTASAQVASIQCNFVQEKTLMALTEKITSTGKFWFKRSNKVRIEYLTPFTYLMVMNEDKILLRDNQKESRVNVKSNKLFQQVNQIMIDCVQGTMLDSKDFTSVAFEGDHSYLLEMTPVTKSLQGFFQTILLTVDKSDFSANSIVMNESAGDMTIIQFTDKHINEGVSDALFAF